MSKRRSYGFKLPEDHATRNLDPEDYGCSGKMSVSSLERTAGLEILQRFLLTKDRKPWCIAASVDEVEWPAITMSVREFVRNEDGLTGPVGVMRKGRGLFVALPIDNNHGQEKTNE